MKYILGVLGVIVLAIIAIAAISFGTSSNTPKESKPSKQNPGVSLVDYDNDNSAVKLTTQGRLVGEEQRRSIRITITQTQRTIDVISGYEQNVIKTESFPNTPAAYSTFLRALNSSNFTRIRKGVSGDERGTCPQGNRYIYELTKGTDQIQRLWNSSCVSSDGSFAGNGPRSRTLFVDQIPNYTSFSTGLNLSI